MKIVIFKCLDKSVNWQEHRQWTRLRRYWRSSAGLLRYVPLSYANRLINGHAFVELQVIHRDHAWEEKRGDNENESCVVDLVLQWQDDIGALQSPFAATMLENMAINTKYVTLEISYALSYFQIIVMVHDYRQDTRVHWPQGNSPDLNLFADLFTLCFQKPRQRRRICWGSCCISIHSNAWQQRLWLRSSALLFGSVILRFACYLQSSRE